jgi:hypothetical protein
MLFSHAKIRKNLFQVRQSMMIWPKDSCGEAMVFWLFF